MHNAFMSYSRETMPHTSGKMCFVQAYAKINLTLDVLGRRPDGYHELRTLMQTIDLYDTLCLSTSDENCVRVICSQPELNTANNLAMQAAEAVRQRLALSRGIVIELHKRIPLAAGLGGGSSDAAAVLLALQQWWQLPLSPADLLMLAASLGSDVPFFLTGGLALCAGRGEQVTALAGHWPASMRWLLLVKPAIGVSTAAVFRTLPASDYTDGTHSRTVYEALLTGKEPEQKNLYNGLERIVLERYPEVAQVREALLGAGASLVRLSGSGPTLFAPFAELDQAIGVQQQLHEQGYEVFLSRAIYPARGNICVL
jgi:4-diphosphocytidyl-2-C-methyl-D-erythritol kinase